MTEPEPQALTKGLKKTTLRYLVALGIVSTAFLIWFALTPLIGNRVSSTFFLVAIIVTGRFAGFGPSWVALVIGGLIVAYIQFQRLGLHDPAFPSILVIFFVLGTILVFLTNSEGTARHTAETNADLLGRQIKQRVFIEQQLREQHRQLELALAAGRMGTSIWDVRGGIVMSSPTNETIHGFSPGHFDGTFEQALKHVQPEDLPALLEHIADAMKSGQPACLTYRVIWPDGSTHWIEGVAEFLCDSDGNLASLRGVCADITARKQTEIALREAEERFHLLALQAPVGIYLADNAGRCTFVNHQWCEISGVQSAEALGLGWQNIIHPDDLARLLEAWSTSIQNNQQLSLEYRYRRKNGDIRWVEGSAVMLRNDRGEIIGHVGTVLDITARKASVEALQQEQELLRESINFHERERQTIAYDIHDGIIQYATGALMLLDGCERRPDGSIDGKDVEPAMIALRKAIAEGRRVMNGIRPPLLDDLGIVAAIESLAVEQRTPTRSVEVIADQSIGRLKPEIESTLYRIAQEALFNAVHHSQSLKIQISLSRCAEFVRLQIKDWGVGFDLSKISRGVHGLSGIQERARLSGGQCDIRSVPQQGTCIGVELPINESNERVVRQSA